MKFVSAGWEPDSVDLPVGISLRNLRKVYKKRKVAVDDLSVNLHQGQISALLGENGAGKTTIM